MHVCECECEVECEWSVAPNDSGRPSLVSFQPGGTVFFEHRNLQGEGRQLYGSVSTSNFFAPQDDLGFKLEYVRPYMRGSRDANKTNFKLSAFNSRKLCAAFAAGPGCDDAASHRVRKIGKPRGSIMSLRPDSRHASGAHHIRRVAVHVLDAVVRPDMVVCLALQDSARRPKNAR